MTKKKSEPNPIEDAIGDRTKTSKDIQPIVKTEAFKQMAKTLDEPSPQEMLTLEELNRQTEERLRDDIPLTEEESLQQTVEISSASRPVPKVPIIPVLKPENQPATTTSSQELPPQKTGTDDLREKEFNFEGVDDHQKHVEQYNKTAEKIGIPKIQPAEDTELTALKKYILDDGFVLSTVAFHIVSLCAEPLTTPSTTTWAYKDRAMIPEMVLSLLNQPGYLDGIWPSLKIIMGSNAGNSAWTAGISTTIAFFDIIRSLPTLKELQNEIEKKP